jgi:hypothetical protein
MFVFLSGIGRTQSDRNLIPVEALHKMLPTAAQIDFYSRRCYDDNAELDYLSPYVPLALYQAALVYSRLSSSSSQTAEREAYNSLKKKLRFFAQRWGVASMFLPFVTVPTLTLSIDLYLAALDSEQPGLMV